MIRKQQNILIISMMEKLNLILRIQVINQKDKIAFSLIKLINNKINKNKFNLKLIIIKIILSKFR